MTWKFDYEILKKKIFSDQLIIDLTYAGKREIYNKIAKTQNV
jgi:hypothetical protein